MALKLQTVTVDGKEYGLLKDGRPLYLDDVDNKELAFDAEETRTTVATLNFEAAKNRTTLKELKEQVGKFGDATPEQIAAYRATIEEFGGVEGIKKLKEKGGVDADAIRKSIEDVYEGKLKDVGAKLEEKDGTIRQLLVGNGFATSKFLAEKTILPPDIAESTFGKYFRVENGKPVGYLGDDPILSRENLGHPASVDEALEVIIGAYPMKDRILKAQGGGSGTPPNGSKPGQNGEKTISRTEFQALPPAQQSALAIARVTITD